MRRCVVAHGVSELSPLDTMKFQHVKIFICLRARRDASAPAVPRPSAGARSICRPAASVFTPPVPATCLARRTKFPLFDDKLHDPQETPSAIHASTPDEALGLRAVMPGRIQADTAFPHVSFRPCPGLRWQDRSARASQTRRLRAACGGGLRPVLIEAALRALQKLRQGRRNVRARTKKLNSQNQSDPPMAGQATQILLTRDPIQA